MLTGTKRSPARLSISARAPSASSAAVRRLMQANRSTDTTPERRLRRTLHALGLRFYKHRRPMPSVSCMADIVFPVRRVCVFVDGCFWHGCSRHFILPKTNPAWWHEKISANRERDLRQARALRRAGWTVFRIWEHELTPEGLEKVAANIASSLAGRRP